MEEQKKFQNVTSRIAASESEITEPNFLSIDLLNHVSLLFQFRALGAGYIYYDFHWICSIATFGAEMCLTNNMNFLYVG